jgi:hypothetical protein
LVTGPDSIPAALPDLLKKPSYFSTLTSDWWIRP